VIQGFVSKLNMQINLMCEAYQCLRTRAGSVHHTHFHDMTSKGNIGIETSCSQLSDAPHGVRMLIRIEECYSLVDMMKHG
jgi:hypothetical protein